MTFNLTDFDSPDTPNDTLSLNLTLTNVINFNDESLIFNTTGTGIEVDEMRRVSDYTIQYHLTGGTNYSEYQQVNIDARSALGFLILIRKRICQKLARMYNIRYRK